MGDLNCNFAAPQVDHNANLLSSIADVYSLQQLITDPTRCTESSSTLIYLIFTSWYDVSHAMGFRVWWRNSIKNHSLTLLDN